MYKIAYLFLIAVTLEATVALNVVLAGDDYQAARRQMVAEIEQMVRQTSGYIGKSVLSEEVMEAMAGVPRHEFVPKSLQAAAYLNRPLPIGNKQTISQPYIVALMTELAAVDKNSVVLEVGTGSGYQAAVLAELVQHVYSIEIIQSLGKRAEKLLKDLGYRNISLKIGDGYHGWKEYAPFDAILVTAAPEAVPQPLLEQLRPGGKMVIPVGSRRAVQSLNVIKKDLDGKIHTREVLPVGFVPLTRTE